MTRSILKMTVLALALVGLTRPVTAEPKPAGESETKKAEPLLKVGDRLPSFALKALNPDLCGKQMVSTKHHVGSKPVEAVPVLLLSFASVYCKPCMKELPELQRFYQKYAKRGLMVLVVDIDREAEDIEVIKKMALDKQFTFPVLSDRFALVARRYAANELPMVLVIDGAGLITWMKIGYEESVLEQIEGAFSALLPPASEMPAPEERKKPTEVKQ